MNILLFARSYEGMAGGIEKMTLLIAKGLVARGHKVVIASIDSVEAMSFYEWPEEVLWEKISFGNAEVRASTKIRFQRALALRNIVKKYQISTAIGFQVGSFALIRLAAFGLRIRVVAAERNAPTLFNFIRHGRLKRFFANLILLNASGVAVQFPNYRNYYPWFLRDKILITPNPVLPPKRIKQIGARDSSRIQLLFVGRLTFQKNLEVLIKALYHCSPLFSLTVIGDGPDLNICRKLALDLGVSVDFLPPSRELSGFYLSADFLVLPSRWEGFPNVVAEALSFGLPVIGFASCSGIPELIENNVNGFACEGEMNEFTLASGISTATELKFDPKIIAESVAQYSFGNFVDSWEKVLA